MGRNALFAMIRTLFYNYKNPLFQKTQGCDMLIKRHLTGDMLKVQTGDNEMAKKNRFLMDEDYDSKDRIDDNDIDDYYVENVPERRRRNRKHVAAVVVAAVVVCVLAVGGMGLMALIDKYTPNNTVIDLYEYYGIEARTDKAENPTAFVMLNGQRSEQEAYCFGDVWYFKKDFVDEYFNHRFYYDMGHDELIYTTPTRIVTIPFDSQAYYVGDTVKKEHYVIARRIDDEIYLAVDFVKERADFIYEVRTEPYRMLITTEYGSRQCVNVADNGTVRTGASIKEPILSVGDDAKNWSVEGEEGDWTKLVTDDNIVGYIRTKELGDSYNITTSNNYQAPIYTSVSKKYKINLAWHAVYDIFDNDDIYGFLDAAREVTTVSPTWYQLTDSQGGYSSLAQQEYVDYVHETGREIWPLWSDFTSVSAEGGWSEYELFSVTENRRALIAAMMSEVELYGYDGINIDFEKVSSDTGIHYVQFLRELSIECRKAGIVLSIDNYVPMGHSLHYDRREQGVIADYVIVMGYDEHYNGCGEAGSVASLEFVTNGIVNTLESVPADKLINALPFYTRMWDEYTDEAGNYVLDGKAYTMKASFARVEELGLVVNWSDTMGQYVAEGDVEGHHYSVWLEDARSIEEKMKVVAEHDLAGIAAWSLGGELPEVWEVISRYNR